jgi:two-component system chemotaxis sensor kinase CheA
VDFSKLDVLLNLVGELVLDRAAVHTVLENFQSAVRALESPRRQLGRHRRSLAPLGSDHRPSPARSRADLPAIHEEIDRLERIFRELSRELDVAAGSLDFVAGELRDQVMKLRMVPISQVFSKHRRTVRDLARTLEKEVKVEIKGEETELDKMLVEKLDEPLMHMVRNAVDHGIESPEQRREASKPEQGTVKLEAKHRGGQLVVEISDDGKGLDPEKIRSKAVERGLLTAEQAEELDDHDALRLIFAPGFSTAKEVTDLSGRGVGMDVVHDAMRKLRGSADVTSVPGASTTFTLSLPLTLAIRQVLLMRVAGELLALPLDNVERTVDIEPHQVREVADRQVLEEASGPLPLVWLEEALGLGPMRSAERRPRNVVCVEVLGRRYGLVCDSLEGKREIVVKTLGDILVRAECAAGGTLVGNRVVIILDLPAVVSRWQGSARSGLARRQAVHQTSDAPAARRVLVAEDSPPARQLLCDLFRKLGFAVVEAADGEQALFELERHHFDLISTDARMPHMDGYELTRRLRHEPRTKNTPVLMISARGERVDKVRGFDAGVDAYLVKPTDAAELAEAVSRLLKTSKRGGAEMEEEP